MSTPHPTFAQLSGALTAIRKADGTGPTTRRALAVAACAIELSRARLAHADAIHAERANNDLNALDWLAARTAVAAAASDKARDAYHRSIAALAAHEKE